MGQCMAQLSGGLNSVQAATQPMSMRHPRSTCCDHRKAALTFIHGWFSISVTVGRSFGFFSSAMVMKSRHCSLILEGNLQHL